MMAAPPPSTQTEMSYASLEDIRHRHGELVWLLYRLSDAISKLSVSHWLRGLPHSKPSLSRWLDSESNKPLPSWQDRVTFLPMLALTVLAVSAGFSRSSIMACAGAAIAGYALFIDTVNYHVRVLWFDDITPGIPDTQRGVWSHRRILFLAILGYLQSILLFPTACSAISSPRNLPYIDLLRQSFLTATLADVPVDLGTVGALQIFTSLFFLVVVIAVISSSGYERSELS